MPESSEPGVRRQKKFQPLEKSSWLYVVCLLILLSAGFGVFGMKQWSDQTRRAVHHSAWQNEKLVQQRQWMAAQETVFQPYLERLQLTHDELLDMSDRIAQWLQTSATPVAEFNWDEPNQLTINGGLRQAQIHASVGLVWHPLEVHSSITDENMLLSMINSVDQIAPGSIDIRSCRLLRTTHTIGLDWRCRLAVIALPDSVETQTVEDSSVPEKPQVVDARSMRVTSKVPAS